MPGPREITDVAIDSALHALPEPDNGWRNQIPPEDLGQMASAGSGQITLQALVASLHYGSRPYAVRVLNHYADVCWSRFMLSEPWSAIYATAIVNCWVVTVLLANRHGEPPARSAADVQALLSERFRRGKLQKARAGWFIGGRAPYGYRYIPCRDGAGGRLETRAHWGAGEHWLAAEAIADFVRARSLLGPATGGI